MSLQTSCPECRTTFRLADAVRGKKVRCSHCKAIFTADASTDDGDEAPAITTTPARAKPAASSTTRKAVPRRIRDDDEDDDRFLKKQEKSMLPYILIGVGLMVFLCGGGSIVGLIAWRVRAAAEEARAAEEAERARMTQANFQANNRFGADADKRFQEEFAKAQAEQDRNRAEMQKRIDEDFQEAKRQQQEQQKLIREGLEEHRKMFEEHLKNMGPGAFPPGMGNPFAPQPPREAVQAVSRNVALPASTHEIASILWPTAQKEKAVVVYRSNKAVRLEQYNLSNGRKLGGMDTPLRTVTASSRDVSADGSYYLCNFFDRMEFSIWNLPNPKTIVDKWQPPPIQRLGAGIAKHKAAAAYLLDGPRLLIIDDAGQVALWSLPKIAGGKPSLQKSYVPKEAEVHYPTALTGKGIALSPDRTHLAVFNGRDGFLLLDTATLQLQGVATSAEDALPDNNLMLGMYGVAFSPDGKHLAALLHSQLVRAEAQPASPHLIRWDVNTRKRTARFADPSQGKGEPDTRIGWWGNDYVWVSSAIHPGNLVSWTKQRVVLHASLQLDEKLCVGSADGKCWFLVGEPGGKANLKGIDLPAEALNRAEQPLELTKEGIVRR